MGARRGWLHFVDEFVRPTEGAAILDVGCGPGDLLDYLPPVHYWGFDISQSYIDYAARKFGGKGRFICKRMTENDLATLPRFDVVVGSGLLHHMDDAAALEYLRLAYGALKIGGRLVTIDPCFAPGQNPIARLLIACDRGQNVRSKVAYEALASQVFCNPRATVRHKAWIPYTHCFMECARQ